jgi:hypothetical protein
MNKKIINFMLMSAFVAGLAACLKDKGFEDQKYGTSIDGTPSASEKSVKILQGGISGGDIRARQLAFADPTATLDSMTFSVAYVDYKSPTASANVNVTIGLDASFIARYNSLQSITYEIMPDSLFSIPSLSTIIKSGETYSPDLKVYFKPNKFDASKIYMLPIKILTATGISGVQIQANYGYIVYSKIGNPLAGTYTVVGTRWNCTAPGDQGYSGGPIPTNFTAAAIPGTKTLDVVGPSTTTTFVANLGAGTARDYFFDIDPAATTIQDINISLTPTFDQGISNVRWLQKDYNPVTKQIILRWTYNNQPGGAGNDRIILETMTKQ